MRVRAATDAELRALGRIVDVCECGVALDVHPPLPKPLDWSHGRPCERAGLRVFSREWRNQAQA